MATNSPITGTNVSKKSNGQSVGTGFDLSLQEKIMKQIRELGDTLERAGEKIEKKGWEKIGHSISKLGNSLEHLKEGKKAYTDKEFEDKTKNPSDAKAPADKIGGSDSQAF